MKEKAFILKEIQSSASVLKDLAASGSEQIALAAKLLTESLQAGGKIWIFGNGGSAADAQHFAAELVGRYKIEREGLAAVAMTTDTSLLTAVSNDFSFEQIFSRQVLALANPGDVVIGITAGGKSTNVLAGLRAGRERGAHTIALVGADTSAVDSIDGGEGLEHLVISVPSGDIPRVQECHAVIIHILCDLVERTVGQGQQ